MSQRTHLLYELRRLKARGVADDSPEWMQALHRADIRRSINPPRNPETREAVNRRLARDLMEFMPQAPEPPAAEHDTEPPETECQSSPQP